MTLRSRFTLAMLAITGLGILLSSGAILYASTRTILAKSEDNLRVSCLSLREAYGAFLAENGRIAERIGASPTFGQVMGSTGLSRLIALRAAESEMAAILAGGQGIEAIALFEEGTCLLSLPAGAPPPNPPGLPGLARDGAGRWRALVECPAAGGRGRIAALVAIEGFGRDGILPLIEAGGVSAYIALAASGELVWKSASAVAPESREPFRATAGAAELVRYRRGGAPLLAFRIEREGLVFLAETSRAAIFSDLLRFTRLAAAAALAILAAGALCAVLISRRLTGSIKSLAEAARRIAGKDYRLDLEVKTGDEMEVLYSAFDSMGRAIAAFTSDLEGIVAERTAELKLRMEEIERLMVTDALTGIANRRKAAETLERETARSIRYGNALALVLFDIDHFKSVNDLHGHAAGDAVLARVARVAASVVRPVDLVARWGGEEFLAVLPETDLEGAFAAAEKIRCAIQDEPPEGGLSVTVSAGAAAYGPPEPPEAFVARADGAMYESKKGGRNRTSRAPAKGEA